ncbi:hypothetical protein [Deinococcus yunweiensis]|uniref:hypothetical protein n=1 Tax=Deinococcus yunweiensis TaxID=367282 RepID=UPI00398E5C34
MTVLTEVLSDVHAQLWVTTGERTLRVQLHPEHGGDAMLPLRLPRVFAAARLTPDGDAILWPGGFTLPAHTLETRRDQRWLTHLGSVPVGERYRPLLPLLKAGTTGVYLHPQPTRLSIIKMFGMRDGELEFILRAHRVPEEVMLHRLYDLGLFLKHHFYPEMPVGVLRRPWAYAAHRVPHQTGLHTLLACLSWGRLDLAEDPCWALARAELRPA